MSNYILKRELPTFKVGDRFFTDDLGSLWLNQTINGKPNTSRVMAYHGKTIEKFPNILTDWFEEVKEPLIGIYEIATAVKFWAKAISVSTLAVSFIDYNDEKYHCKMRIEPADHCGEAISFWVYSENKFSNGVYSLEELVGEL